MRAILTSLALLAAAPATAQSCNPPILTFRGDTLTYETPATDVYANGGVAAIVDDYVEGQTILIDAGARTTRNVNLAEVTLAELQVLVGADHVAFIGPVRCRPKMPSLPEDLFPEGDPAAPNTPVVLFPDDPVEGGPRDGLWQANIGPIRTQGCPPMVAQAVPNTLGALPGIPGDTRRMTFSSPFDPNTLEMSHTMKARWSQTGKNRWETDVSPEVFDQIPQGAGGGSRLSLLLEVVRPDLIRFDHTIEIVLPDVAVAMLGVSSDGCRVSGSDTWQRIGD
ncbi:hypothetical protein [Celeribacter baekdonensis]|uniref:Uncharacterized protein n=1 Tax=Celeribacter baekdonensis TaxID=875171 RepID=A0A2R4M3S5_9RHOB|nr:hypothetical protein [Celeribacter baekdonensis]AVW91759.1 hypothetical protein DA792_12315 [Celeribacter baekdonensis]